MILKFNNGRGALLCEHCNIIIMENFLDYEWKALCSLNDKNMEWFCKECDPKGQQNQMNIYLNEIDFYAKSYSKEIQKRLKEKYKQF